MFVCGRPKYDVEKYIQEIHQLYPGVTIIGGVCAGGHVTDRYWEEEGNPKIKKITNGIFGLAMRGIPLRCVVSRGVESIMPSHGSRAEIVDFEYVTLFIAHSEHSRTFTLEHHSSSHTRNILEHPHSNIKQVRSRGGLYRTAQVEIQWYCYETIKLCSAHVKRTRESKRVVRTSLYWDETHR